MASPADYRLLVTGEALRFLLTLRAPERLLLERAFQFLVDQPHFSGGYQERDADGRLTEVFLRGHFAIAFWTDDAVREVRIVRVEKA